MLLDLWSTLHAAPPASPRGDPPAPLLFRPGLFLDQNRDDDEAVFLALFALDAL